MKEVSKSWKGQMINVIHNTAVDEDNGWKYPERDIMLCNMHLTLPPGRKKRLPGVGSECMDCQHNVAYSSDQQPI